MPFKRLRMRKLFRIWLNKPRSQSKSMIKLSNFMMKRKRHKKLFKKRKMRKLKKPWLQNQ